MHVISYPASERTVAIATSKRSDSSTLTNIIQTISSNEEH